MSIHAHIDSLSEKRTQIKEQIAEESRRPAPDLMLITQLKKQNLLLKQEMQRYLSMLSRKSSGATS